MKSRSFRPRVEPLEPRVTPVVGAFAYAPETGTGTAFDGVVALYVADGLGSGTLLADGRHVLTAAHVVDDNGDRVADSAVLVVFDLPGGEIDMTVQPAQVYVWPGWAGLDSDGDTGTDNNDLAILTLPDLAPSGSGGAPRSDLYRAGDEVGQTYVEVGYGETGTGATGNVDGTSGDRRYGSNKFETTGADAPDDNLVRPGFGLVADFDDGTAAHDALGVNLGIADRGLGTQEAALAFGDSGGPAFLESNGTYLIAGVAANLVSGGRADIDPDQQSNSSFGDLMGFTRVSAYAAAIDAQDAGPFDLAIDLNHQPLGNDGQPDAVTVTASGSTVTVTVDGQVLESVDRSLLRSVTVTASTDGGTFAVAAAVPGDLLVREVGFESPADARASVAPATRPDLPAVAPLAATTAGKLFAVGADAGGEPRVNVYTAAGALVFSFEPFAQGFTGGVRVAVGDVTGDGYPDVVVGAGPGGSPVVRIVDGRGAGVVDTFDGFEDSFTGGVFVATGDFNGDGKADVVVTPDQGGGPRVRVVDGATRTVVADFFGIADPAFRGGARAAVGDVNGDGTPDLIVAAGFGGGPRVAVFDGSTLDTNAPTRLVGDFFVFEPTLRNGVFVAAGDVDGDGFADVVVGGGPGGGPRVYALSGKDLLAGATTQLANFFAGDPDGRGGARVATKDLDGDGFADIVAGAGPAGGSRVTAYIGSETRPDGVPGASLSFDAFPGVTDGVYVG